MEPWRDFSFLIPPGTQWRSVLRFAFQGSRARRGLAGGTRWGLSQLLWLSGLVPRYPVAMSHRVYGVEKVHT